MSGHKVLKKGKNLQKEDIGTLDKYICPKLKVGGDVM